MEAPVLRSAPRCNGKPPEPVPGGRKFRHLFKQELHSSDAFRSVHTVSGLIGEADGTANLRLIGKEVTPDRLKCWHQVAWEHSFGDCGGGVGYDRIERRVKE